MGPDGTAVLDDELVRLVGADQRWLETALARLASGAEVKVAGAGRTDDGVHALGQVASFSLEREAAPSELQRALNGMLPADVRVLLAERVPEGFHARRAALFKLYSYVLDCGGVPPPQRSRFAGFVPWSLAEPAVLAAAALYLGRRDFASLASSGGSVKTSVRTVTRSLARFEGTTLVYEVEADGFLRIDALARSGQRAAASHTACSPPSNP